MKKETLFLLLLLGVGGYYLYTRKRSGLVTVESPEKITEKEFENPDPRTQLDLLMRENTGYANSIDPGYLFAGSATISPVLSEPLFPDPVRDNAYLDPSGGGGGYIDEYTIEQRFDEKMNYLQAASVEDMRLSGVGKRKQIGDFV